LRYGKQKNALSGADMGIRVLIVDDSSTIRRIISRCLERAEVGVSEVFEASDGREALDLLNTQQVDVVLTDINMPNMNGLELLCEIKQSQQWAAIPVLVITPEGGEDAVVEAVNRGAAGYLRKPFNPTRLKSQFVPILASVPVTESGAECKRP
jgi:two-component system chemotaxis response regulator CheY